MTRIGASFKDNTAAAKFANHIFSQFSQKIASVSLRGRNIRNEDHIVDAEIVDNNFLEEFKLLVEQYNGKILENEYLEASVDLYEGISNSYVIQAKFCLQDKGYYLGNKYDDYFEPELTQAVKAFQQDHALPATGSIDSTTWMKLTSK